MESKRNVSSRLIKQEGKKIARQTMMFGVAAVVLILIFIFVVLPLFIRFVNSVLGTNPIAEDETVFLQPPVISAPVAATNSAQLRINGFSSAEYEVVVLLSGQEYARVPANTDGTFTAEIELTEGENTVTSYTIDPKSNKSNVGQTYTIVLDTEDPELEVTSPKDGDTIDTRDTVINVEGTTEPGSRVFVNDRVVFPSADGSFTARHSLKEGSNEIIVKARDPAGNETELKLTVKYSP